MNKNVGELDSRIRSRLGTILILVGVLGFFNLVEIGLIAKIALLAVGAILFITGSSRTCGVYAVLGMDTTGSDED